MYFAVAIRGAVAVQRTSAVRETGASRIQSCDRGRAGTGASSNDCDGGSNYADPIKSRKLWHWLSSWLLGRAGRRFLPAALLLALALPAALLPLAGPAAAQEVVEVPRGWPLTPSEISTDGKFRLLFVTSTGRNASSSNIADYNSVRAGPGGSRTCRHPVLLLEVPGPGQHRVGGCSRQHRDDLHRPGQGRADLLARRRQGRRRLRGLLRRQLGQQERQGKTVGERSQSDSGCLICVDRFTNNNGVKAG